ncbi:hypothetical protein MMC32_006091 [Xylographa parallela]|nr:hypothetical protein [Xylographa parallela]
MLSKPPAGSFTLLYFASASTFTRKTSEHIPAPLGASKLFKVLEERYPGFHKKVLDSCAVTINLEYVDIEADLGDDPSMADRIIQEGDEVAIIPPVSSG